MFELNLTKDLLQEATKPQRSSGALYDKGIDRLSFYSENSESAETTHLLKGKSNENKEEKKKEKPKKQAKIIEQPVDSTDFDVA